MIICTHSNKEVASVTNPFPEHANLTRKHDWERVSPSTAPMMSPSYWRRTLIQMGAW